MIFNFIPPVSQREALSARRIAVARRGMMITPATAQRTVWKEETAAPTISRSAKVHIIRSFPVHVDVWKCARKQVMITLCCGFSSEVRLHGCKGIVRRSRAPSVPQGESETDVKGERHVKHTM